MKTSQDTAISIANGCFAWLLSGGTSNTWLRETTPNGPDELSHGLENGSITETESLAIWCFLSLVAQVDSSLEFKASALGARLLVPNEFAVENRETLLTALRKCDDKFTAESFLQNPPPSILQAITEAVAQHQLKCVRKKKLIGLKSCILEHPTDRMMLAKFKAIPGAEKIVSKFLDFFHKRPHEVSLLTGAVRVTSTSLPWLHDCFVEACMALDIKNPPDLYVVEGGINAYTTGAESPIIVVQAGAVNLLDRQEMLYLLGHELGHVMAGHVMYGLLASWIVGAAGIASALTLGLGGIVADATVLSALYAWMRRSEYTADRAGLLACQSQEAVLRAMLKLTGYPARFYGSIRTRALLEQVALCKEKLSNNAIDRLFDLNEVWGQNHPRAITRVSELLEWLDDGCYEEILEATPEYMSVMAKRTQQDPRLQALFSASSRELTAWASTRFNVRKSIAGPIVRRMLGEGVSPAASPLEPILRVELQIIKAAANAMKYNLIFLTHENAQALKHTIPLPFDPEWDATPTSICNEIIRSGEKELTFLFYTVGARK